MHDSIASRYGHQVRIRVCGLCWDDHGRLLMVNHNGLTKGDFWAPPGGGVEFGENLNDTLTREFREETGLVIVPQDFLFICERVRPPLHSIELFFAVTIKSGTLTTGTDPELPIISDARFMAEREWQHIPPGNMHGIFEHVSSFPELRNLRGFFAI